MEIKTFRAKTMKDALALVRRELGPDASVLHTRELNGDILRRIVFGRSYEVAASATVNVPSRLPARMREPAPTVAGLYEAGPTSQTSATAHSEHLGHVAGQIDRLQEMIEQLCGQVAVGPKHDLPETL